MDMRFEAAPMAAEALMTVATVKTVVGWSTKASMLVQRVASFSCPSLGSHSLSAVAPDLNFREELALAGA